MRPSLFVSLSRARLAGRIKARLGAISRTQVTIIVALACLCVCCMCCVCVRVCCAGMFELSADRPGLGITLSEECLAEHGFELKIPALKGAMAAGGGGKGSSL
jgi:hypothetical protein